MIPLVIIIIALLSVGGSPASELYAQEQKEEAIYFIDGNSVKGIILEINREKIRIQLKNGDIIERSIKDIHRFSSGRPFIEIYRQAVASEIEKPIKTNKSKDIEAEQDHEKWQSNPSGVTDTTAVGQYQTQDEKNPFNGLWKSKIGSIVKIDGNQGILIYTPSESWKKFLHKITIKNIRQIGERWIADELIISDQDNIWIETEWKLVDNKIKRNFMFKEKKLESFFLKTTEGFFHLTAESEHYFNRGVNYRLNGQYNMAISDLDKAIKLNPEYGVAYYNRGVAYQDKGQYDKAISDFNKAIYLNSNDAAAYCNRGIIYFIQEEYDNAWKDFKQAQVLGAQTHPKFLKMLREASGGEK